MDSTTNQRSDGPSMCLIAPW